MGKRRRGRENIHVLYALVDKRGAFSKMAGTSMCSLFENTKERVTIHLFHDGTIQGKNKENFEMLAERYGQCIRSYNVRKLLPEVWKEAKEIFEEALNSPQYTEATLYRLVAPQILPQSIGRLIYIDADTIVHMDIRKLWQEPIGTNGMAAVRESTLLLHYGMRPIGGSKEPMYNRMKDSGLTMENCFNAGILLMDLTKIRPMGNILLSGLRILAKYPEENHFYDQNILNYYFAKDLAPLPWNYNILLHWDKEHVGPHDTEGIYHYMGKSLSMNGRDVRDTLFYSYFIKTPWCDGEFICRIHGVMDQVYVQMIGPKLRFMRRLTALLAVKCPVVAYSTEYESLARKLFADPDSFDVKKEKKESAEDSMSVQSDATAARISADEETQEKAQGEPEYEFPEGVCALSLGSEAEGIHLTLPYDVNHHFYLLFVHDYPKAKALLQSSGLRERDHYMDGTFLLVGKPWLEGLIQPQRFFEML